MALSKTSLKNRLKAEMQTAFGATTPSDATLYDKMCLAIANAVVDEITTNAQVVVASVSGVMTGSSASGPGTGTVQ